MKRHIPLKFKNGGGTFVVLPDGAAQLIGYDTNGNEIYEDDPIFHKEIFPDFRVKRYGGYPSYGGIYVNSWRC